MGNVGAMNNGRECAVVGSLDPVMADLSYERSGVVLSLLASPPEADSGWGRRPFL